MSVQKSLMLGALLFGLAAGAAQALEPVNPQPAMPLTFKHPAYQKGTPEVARQMIEDGVVVLDVRNPVERLKEGYIAGSYNVSLQALKPGARLAFAPDLDQKILVHCRSGVRAEQAAKILVQTGYRHVYNMYGTLQWPYGLVNGKEN